MKPSDLMNENATTRWLDIPAAAAHMHVAVKFVRNLIWDGEISHVRAGRRFIVDVRELDGWAERNKQRFGRT